MPIESETQPAEKLKREIAKSYDSNPKGWTVVVGKDSRRFSQILVSNPSQAWILKEEWINPYKSIGLGAQLVGGIESLNSKLPQEFGLRPLAPQQIRDLSNLAGREENPRELLLEIMRSQPVASKDIHSPLVLQGPIMTTSNPLSLISKKHEELDRHLSEELERLLLRKHPQAITTYR
ncbi:hypothetical protein MUP59_08735 [Candidatus Bathyarchaeota archaeon]|nr:hypothetical protein [Candidatus Bathyarchaeota archaeon]